MVLLCAVLMATSPFAAATHRAYVKQDVERLRELFTRADSRVDSLLVRFRLYPLTENKAVLKGIPSTLADGSGREYALLSGLWAYRAGEASFFSALQYGRRSAQLLEQATSRAPTDPFVLLVEGQSLLFRPVLAGRDPAAAAERFARLADVVEAREVAGVSRTEAQAWRWLALTEADQQQAAEALRKRLERRDLPPLYRQFLEDPPDV